LEVLHSCRLYQTIFPYLPMCDWTMANTCFIKGSTCEPRRSTLSLSAPPGVFLIEVKQWSQAFAESGNFHDPYNQCRRASDLCYKMLKEYGLNTKVRTILATRSQLSAKPAESYVKVLTPSALCGYIRYFPQAYDAEQLAHLTAFMRRWQV